MSARARPGEYDLGRTMGSAGHFSAAWLARPIHWLVMAPLAGLATLLLPPAAGRPALTLVIASSCVGCGLAFLARARRFPAEAAGWRWFALGFFLYALLGSFEALTMLTVGASIFRPIELIALPAALCNIVGLLGLPGAPARPGARLRTGADALVFALSMLALQWLLGVAELNQVPGMTRLQVIFAITPFASLTMTMGLIVYLARLRPERYLGALGILFVAALLGVSNNLLGLLGALEGRYELGDPLDLLSLFSVWCCGLASLYPHPIEHGQRVPFLERCAAFVPYVPLVAVISLLIQQQANGWLASHGDVLWLVYPLMGAVLLSQYLTLSDLRTLSSTLELQVDARTRALAEAREQLLSARRLEALGRLAGTLAHDFNNLLTGIGGRAHLVARAAPEEPTAAYAVDVQRAVERGAALTRQILAFARRQPGEPRVLAPAQVVRDLERLLLRLVGEDVELVLLPVAAVEHVRVDPGQLEQVVVNLVVNARDAMPGGGRIEIGLDTVEIDAAQAERAQVDPGAFLVLSVADTGVGMSREARAHLFEPFYTTKPAGKGTGLGLSTCYGIVCEAGGFFTVESEPGKGSRFMVHLPVTHEAMRPAEPSPPSWRPGSSRCVLLVDDSPALRATLAESLRGVGFEVLEAASAAEAIERCAEHRGAIDVLVTDVVMAGMRGHELAAEVARARPAVRTVLISGYDELSEAVLPGEVAFLAKPFLPDDLVRKIGQTLEGAVQP